MFYLHYARVCTTTDSSIVGPGMVSDKFRGLCAYAAYSEGRGYLSRMSDARQAEVGEMAKWATERAILKEGAEQEWRVEEQLAMM